MTEFIILLSIVFLMIVSQTIISFTYSRYSREEASLPITGKETVENMLNRNCITDVRLGYTTGTLNDHYNSNRKTINLSKSSCNTSTVAAIAVAAHETGHAIQDHTNYFMLRIRKLLAPITAFSSRFVWIAIFIGVIFQSFNLIVLGLALMGVTIVFQLVTLPVEFDASRRAVAYLSTVGYDAETMTGIKKMLKAAAFTYVASTLAALLQMLRLVLAFTRND
jgi:Zn-dependent membrane protease YugP